MRLLFLLDRRPHPMPTLLLRQVFGLLRRRGFEVRWAFAEELLTRADELRVEHDVYLLKSYTDLALSLAALLHEEGARVLNPYPGCAACRDKIASTRRLRAAGVPVPRTWTTADPARAATLLGQTPLVVKPSRGLHGGGVKVVRSAQELPAELPPGAPTLFQEYVRGAGEDVKLYCVGEEVLCVRKAFDAESFGRPGRHCPVPDDLREIALRCGWAFGLGLYGLDVIEGPGGPVVVDLNYFPGYRGVPGAGPLVAAYVEEFARGEHELALPELSTLGG